MAATRSASGAARWPVTVREGFWEERGMRVLPGERSWERPA